METRAHPQGLQDLLEFPLVEALYGRRARRFSLGASIPDGPAGIHLQARAAATLRARADAGADGGGGQHGLALHDHAPRRLRSPPLELLRCRRRPHVPVCGRLPHQRAVLHRRRGRLPLRDPRRPRAGRAHNRRSLPTSTRYWMPTAAGYASWPTTRLHIPDEEPYMEGHNTWCANRPGSTLLIPVGDIAQHMIAILCFLVQNGYAMYDDVNGERIPGSSASPTWWTWRSPCR